MLRLLAFLLLLPLGALAEREVHVVSVFSGFRPPGDLWAVPEARVHVDRPGASVTLVLLDRGPLRWFVTVTPETTLEAILVGGDEPSASELFLSDIPWPLADPLPHPPQIEKLGSGFRTLVGDLTAQFETERLSSFQSRHQAPAEGFVVDRVDGRPDLAPGRLDNVMAPLPAALSGGTPAPWAVMLSLKPPGCCGTGAFMVCPAPCHGSRCRWRPCGTRARATFMA